MENIFDFFALEILDFSLRKSGDLFSSYPVMFN